MDTCAVEASANRDHLTLHNYARRIENAFRNLRLWLKLWMKIVESKDVLRIKRFLLKNHIQPKRY